MAKIPEDTRRQIEAVGEIDKRLMEIFTTTLRIGTNEGEYGSPGYQAYALLAIDVAMSICNMFLAIKNPQSGRTYRMACDLTYGLNTNEFWQKNASILLPAIHVSLNTFRDGAALELEKLEAEAYSSSDELIVASKAAPLEIFPLIAYCIGGAPLMMLTSVPLKQALSPYFLR